MDCICHGVVKTRTCATFTHVFIESVMPSNYPIFCCHLLLLPSFFPSIRVFSSELALHIRWPKYQIISFSISLSKEYSELISSRTDRFDLHAVLGLSRVFSSTTIQNNQFCAQPSLGSNFHIHLTTGKTIALTLWIFFSKVMPLLFNTLCRFVIAYLPRRKCLLISWLQSPSQ